jgi:hypothetical protein
MRILYIELVNFVGVKAAMGLDSISFSFEKVDKPIIQLYGKNRCGKTVLIQQLHPFSSINLAGDERNDLSLIIPGKNGSKVIVYEVGDKVYKITHTYRATPKNHQVTSSIICDGVELNENGGVNNFNRIIENLFGINKYRFQFIINGTQLMSFGNMSSVQRKTLLNKALGVDIYDKIHKMATDDFRYTNRLLGSLNDTCEHLLLDHGSSYETLLQKLNHHKELVVELTTKRDELKSRLDRIVGELQTLQMQNPNQELIELQSKMSAYVKAMDAFDGSIDLNLYDTLVNDQIELNKQLSELKSQYQITIHDIDELYAKKHDIESTILNQQKALSDLNDMERIVSDLNDRLSMIDIRENVENPSSSFRTMLTLAQAINSMCNEISTCLSDAHLKLFAGMVNNNIDISAFLIQEGSILMDSEKEKSVISRVQSIVFSTNGDEPEDCVDTNCIYRRTYDALREYFKSYQSTTENKFTQYDLEQFDHANKNLASIKRMLVVEIPDELKNLFNIKTIITNISKRKPGVDVDRIKYLMEEAAKIELRLQYIKQINDVERSIDQIKKIIPTSISENESDVISTNIQTLELRKRDISESILGIQGEITDIDNRRLLLADIKNMDVKFIEKRIQKLQAMMNRIQELNDTYSELNQDLVNIMSQLQQCQMELDVLDKVNSQYMKNQADISSLTPMDGIYKIIAEATSPTKGKPVIAIRDTVNRAMYLTNQLLSVMYDDEIQLLEPIIDETEFTLPFRCGFNKASDIRYGSQSENTLLSLALSLSLASSMTEYNCYLIDEIDAYLDMAAKDGFVSMLQEMMVQLGSEQIFVISHSVGEDQYPHTVHTINISKRIEELS